MSHTALYALKVHSTHDSILCGLRLREMSYNLHRLVVNHDNNDTIVGLGSLVALHVPFDVHGFERNRK